MTLFKLFLIALAALGSVTFSSCQRAKTQLELMESMTDEEFTAWYCPSSWTPAYVEMIYEGSPSQWHTLHLVTLDRLEREARTGVKAATPTPTPTQIEQDLANLRKGI